LLLDYSKNRITEDTMGLLLELAREQQVPQWIERMFAGERINGTEDRAVLHVALRNRANRPIEVDGEDVMPAVNAVLARMRDFTRRVRTGKWRATAASHHRCGEHRHRRFRPRARRWCARRCGPMAATSCAHFVSNVDGSQIGDTPGGTGPGDHAVHRRLQDLHHPGNPDQCPHRARLAAGCGRDEEPVARHFVAVSTNDAAVRAFGIDTANMFEFWDWVGGRYSLWSAIGLPIALYIGMDEFRGTAGRRACHGRAFPHRAAGAEHAGDPGPAGRLVHNFFGAESHAVLPYDQHLHRCRPTCSRPTWRATASRVTATASRGLQHRPGDLGRAGHQRPARLLPADPPGHPADPGGFPRRGGAAP
jgi:glucose-6-phosphate isomerase